MKKLRIALLLASFFVVGSASAATVTMSYEGVLSGPDFLALSVPVITVTEDVIFSARTFSYAGGTQANGNEVAAGGFDPILTLFTMSGTVIAQSDDGAGVIADTTSFNEVAGTDTGTGAAFDSFIDGIFLSAGTYIVGISQWSFFPTGFGPGTSGMAGFIDATGDARSSAFAYDVTLSTVPVPAAGILFASALFGAGALGRRKKQTLTHEAA